MPADQPESPVHLIYPFRFVDPRTGRWVRARYRATPEQIAQRYAQLEIAGEPERVDISLGSFNPHRRL